MSAFHVRLTAVLAALLVATGMLTAGAAAKPSKSTAGLTVLAAASLVDVLPAIERDNAYSFAGSNALATQIRNGAPGDLFLSANAEIPALLHQQGFVDAPVNFVRNALVLIVPKSNPGDVRSVYDLTKSNLKLIVAAPAVPVGSYTVQVLKQMNLTSRVLPNVVSQETDVRAVLTKVALGQGDAGFVYLSDARSVPNDVTVIRLPAWAQPKVMYALAIVSKSANKAAARAFVAKLLGKAAQETFRKHGFLPLSGATASTPKKLSVVKVTRRVKRGKAASLTVASPLRTACTIRVFDASGKRIAAKGLARKQPTASGIVLWRWAVPRAAAAGRSPIQVKCGPSLPGLRTSYTVLR
jgi:molybdate transport system substrate-binding protein